MREEVPFLWAASASASASASAREGMSVTVVGLWRRRGSGGRIRRWRMKRTRLWTASAVSGFWETVRSGLGKGFCGKTTQGRVGTCCACACVTVFGHFVGYLVWVTGYDGSVGLFSSWARDPTVVLSIFGISFGLFLSLILMYL